MRKQVELKFFIGYDDKQGYCREFETLVIKTASRMCGGCYVGGGTGYWMEDGAEHKPRFTGELKAEHCLHIVLSCEEDKVEDVLVIMRTHIAAYAQYCEVDTNWVHIQKTEFQGLQFSVKNLQNEIPINLYQDIVRPVRYRG